MKIKYMFEYAIRNAEFVLAGIWVHGPRGGLDIDFEFLPGFEDHWDDANDLTNRLVESGANSVPDDFLDDLSERMGSYSGRRDQPVETVKYGTLRDCMATELSREALARSIAAKIAQA